MEEPTSSKPEPSAADLLAHVQSVWARIQPDSHIYHILLSPIAITSATPGRIVARLPLAAVHLNSKKTLHGAVSATIVDWAGGMALAATGLARTGVSVDIGVQYVSAAREGDTLEIEAWVSRAGRNLGFTSVEIRKAVEGEGKGPVVATGSHTKYLNV